MNYKNIEKFIYDNDHVGLNFYLKDNNISLLNINISFNECIITIPIIDVLLSYGLKLDNCKFGWTVLMHIFNTNDNYDTILYLFYNYDFNPYIIDNNNNWSILQSVSQCS